MRRGEWAKLFFARHDDIVEWIGAVDVRVEDLFWNEKNQGVVKRFGMLRHRRRPSARE